MREREKKQWRERENGTEIRCVWVCVTEREREKERYIKIGGDRYDETLK